MHSNLGEYTNRKGLEWTGVKRDETPEERGKGGQRERKEIDRLDFKGKQKNDTGERERGWHRRPSSPASAQPSQMEGSSLWGNNRVNICRVCTADR